MKDKRVWSLVVLLFLVICCFGLSACAKTVTGINQVDRRNNYNTIEAGSYMIGDELSKGEYLLIADDGSENRGVFEVVTKEKVETFDEIFSSENFIFSTYITVENGQYLRFVDCTAMTADSEYIDEEKDIINEGMYKIGKDIMPGTYTIYPKNQKDMFFGAYEIHKDSLHNEDSIIDSGYFQDKLDLKLEEGQYLIIIDAYIEQ